MKMKTVDSSLMHHDLNVRRFYEYKVYHGTIQHQRKEHRSGWGLMKKEKERGRKRGFSALGTCQLAGAEARAPSPYVSLEGANCNLREAYAGTARASKLETRKLTNQPTTSAFLSFSVLPHSRPCWRSLLLSPFTSSSSG